MKLCDQDRGDQVPSAAMALRGALNLATDARMHGKATRYLHTLARYVDECMLYAIPVHEHGSAIACYVYACLLCMCSSRVQRSPRDTHECMLSSHTSTAQELYVYAFRRRAAGCQALWLRSGGSVAVQWPPLASALCSSKDVLALQSALTRESVLTLVRR